MLFSSPKFLVPAIAGLLLIGCQSESEEPVATSPEPTVEAEQAAPATAADRRRRERQPERQPEATADAQTDFDPARRIPRLEGKLQNDGYGPSMLLDGSSPEAFLESLEMMAAESSTQQYANVDRAIRFLHTYSTAGGNLANFYRTLDGISGEEAMGRAADHLRR